MLGKLLPVDGGLALVLDPFGKLSDIIGLVHAIPDALSDNFFVLGLRGRVIVIWRIRRHRHTIIGRSHAWWRGQGAGWVREVLPPLEDYPRAPVFLVLVALVKEMVFVAERVFAENYAARRELAVEQPLTGLRLEDELFVRAVRGCVTNIEVCFLGRRKQSLLLECLP